MGFFLINNIQPKMAFFQKSAWTDSPNMFGITCFKRRVFKGHLWIHKLPWHSKPCVWTHNVEHVIMFAHDNPPHHPHVERYNHVFEMQTTKKDDKHVFFLKWGYVNVMKRASQCLLSSNFTHMKTCIFPSFPLNRFWKTCLYFRTRRWRGPTPRTRSTRG